MSLSKTHRCIRCKRVLDDLYGTSTLVYLSEEADPLRSMPMCFHCAIIVCFRIGKAKRA